MTSQNSDEDDLLLAQLRTAVRQAGTPTPTMVAAGQAAFSWRTVDAELAALSHDSLADESALVRSSAAPRSLVFEGRELSVELDETDDGLVGQLVPPTSGEAALLGPDGELGQAEIDELGCFCFETSSVGLVRLRCRTSSGVLMTDWFRL
ncbi:hypothetical protein [Geodermatophilus sp. CPCC 205506]|uniref:hypothetical protein n=1 Tax=Geodermatophilus sp. CPCC 205506 TaxID=2936596 RepID=UPI003EE92C33